MFLELEASKKQTEADKKVIDDLVRERDILNKVNKNLRFCNFTSSLFLSVKSSG